jgi:AcrR family transcriptional regulator
MTFGTQRPSRASYHHGNLREALIEAALDMIAARGPNGFTLAEVARAVGVSGAAPYRHFKDRNALIAEIARQGFERFAAELRVAWDDGRPSPRAAIENCGRTYLAFARKEPAFYAAMFEPGFPLEDEPALLAASERAFGVLREAADAAIRALPGPNRPPALMVALHIWSMAHGVASLFIEGPSGARRRLPMPPEDLLEAGLLIYLQSLAKPT